MDEFIICWSHDDFCDQAPYILSEWKDSDSISNRHQHGRALGKFVEALMIAECGFTPNTGNPVLCDAWDADTPIEIKLKLLGSSSWTWTYNEAMMLKGDVHENDYTSYLQLYEAYLLEQTSQTTARVRAIVNSEFLSKHLKPSRYDNSFWIGEKDLRDNVQT